MSNDWPNLGTADMEGGTCDTKRVMLEANIIHGIWKIRACTVISSPAPLGSTACPVFRCPPSCQFKVSGCRLFTSCLNHSRRHFLTFSLIALTVLGFLNRSVTLKREKKKKKKISHGITCNCKRREFPRHRSLWSRSDWRLR